MRCGKIFDLSKIVAISETKHVMAPGWGNGCKGCEIYLEFVENPVIIHDGFWEAGEKRAALWRQELLDKWIEFKQMESLNSALSK